MGLIELAVTVRQASVTWTLRDGGVLVRQDTHALPAGRVDALATRAIQAARAGRFDDATFREAASALLPGGSDPLVGMFAAGSDRRVVLETEPDLAGVPWEAVLAAAPLAPARVVRRSQDPALTTEHVQLPLPIDVVRITPRAPDEWGAGLFDEWSQTQFVFGGPAAPLRHVVWSSADADVATLAARLDALAPARLLVIHDLAAVAHVSEVAGEAMRQLDRGADAVLAAAFTSAGSGADEFFPRFYDALVAGLPIDACHAAAARFRFEAPSVSSLLALRAGGERPLRPAPEAGAEPPPAPTRAPERPPPAPSRAPERPPLPGVARHALRFRRRVEVELDRAPADESERFAGLDHDLAALDDEELHAGTFRTVKAWITDAGVRLPADRPLVVGRWYRLAVQIGHPDRDALAQAPFPEERLAELFRSKGEVTLDVVVYSPDFMLPKARTTLTLPRVGESEGEAVPLLPHTAGRCRLRIGIYHANVMLQSLELAISALDPGRLADGEGEPATGGIDYLAAGSVDALDPAPAPGLSLFQNDAGDGSHWIGAFGADGPGLPRSGSLHAFDGDELALQAQAMRASLAAAEGVEDTYRYRAAWDAVKASEQAFAARVASLVDLAATGWSAYATLLFEREEAGDAALTTLLESRGESLVSVARCRGTGPSVPWAALYDRRVDFNAAAPPALCGVFTEQLRANEWADDGSLAAKHDLLDDPASCRAQAACPLGGPEAARTVCPFGFWGFAHQVEQPLQQVETTVDGSLPDYAQDPAFTQTARLTVDTKRRPRALMGVSAGMPGVEAHRDELAALGLELDYTADRDAVLGRLVTGGDHVYYLYCHGEAVGERPFRLRFGPADAAGYIDHTDLSQRVKWPPPSALVVINGCDTVAVTPEVSHRLMHRLRVFGASGVIGTEIQVWTEFAAPFGEAILRRLLAGASIGEAFLAERRHLLRRLNPLGLAYSFYAPAALHLHPVDDAGCAWCERMVG